MTKPNEITLDLHKHFYDTEQVISYRGLELTVLPGVFVPRQISRVTGISPKNLRMYQDKDVLDMGCGSGIQSLIAFKAGARSILAADINLLACRNTELNFRKYSVANGTVRESDLFQNVPEKFDSIVAYLPSINSVAHDMKERAVYDQDFQTFRNFLKEARHHLNPQGVIYACWVNIDNSIEYFYGMLEEYGYVVLDSRVRTFEGEEWWMLDLALVQ